MATMHGFYEHIYANKLKDIPVYEIQKAIAKAVSELIGTGYNCRIEDIEYLPAGNTTSSIKGAKFKLELVESMEE